MAKFGVEKRKYFDYGQKATDLELNSLELRMAKEYKKASQEATAKMNKHLADFKRKDDERRELVSSGKWTQQDYIEWRQGQIYIAGRWNELSSTLAQDYVNTNQITASMLTDHNYDVFALNHNYGAFEIDSQVPGATWTLYNRKSVEQLAKGNKKLPLQTKINVPKDFKWNKRQIESAMMQGLLQGESVDKIAKRLPLAVGETNLNGATRRARTLTTFAENSGRMEAYQEAVEMGIEMQKCWVATLDNRTRDSHALIDGECVDIDEPFSNGLMYPGDESGDAGEVYNCRCTMVTQIKGHERDVTELSNRNIDHLESDYETWYSNHTPYEWEDTEESVPEVTTQAVNADIGETGKMYTDEQRKELQELLDDAPDEEREVWEKFQNDFGPTHHTNRGGYHSFGDVYLDTDRVAKGDSLHTPFQTHYHEYGHNIDFLARQNGQYATQWWRDENGKSFNQIINEEWMQKFTPTPYEVMEGEMYSILYETDGDIMENLRKYGASRLNEWKKEVDGFADNIDLKAKYIDIQKQLRNVDKQDTLGLWHIITDNQDVFVTSRHSSPNNRMRKQIQKKRLKKYCIDMKRNYSLRARGDLSDMLEPVSIKIDGIDYPFGAGHGKNYHKTRIDSSGKETFAEMFSSELANKESIELIKKELPNSYAAYKKILGEIMK